MPQEQPETAPEFYTKDGILYYKDIKGDMYRVDFNEQVYKRTFSVPPENKNISETMDKTDVPTGDLTQEQYRENYFHETKETKLDGSTAMMETRIAKCIEAGGSKEECSRKVKAEMKEKGSENTNTEDMDKPEEKKIEKVEICEKELDMLKKDSEELKKLKEEKKTLESKMEKMEKDFTEWGGVIAQIKQEREAELEEQRQAKIKKLSKDFQIPEKDLSKDALKNILENPTHDAILDFLEESLDKAGKRAKEEEEIAQDFSKYLTDMEKQHSELMSKLKHT